MYYHPDGTKITKNIYAGGVLVVFAVQIWTRSLSIGVGQGVAVTTMLVTEGSFYAANFASVGLNILANEIKD